MKLAILTPNNAETGKTPEQIYAEGLRTLGNDVILGETFKIIPEDTDVIVSLSETTVKNAYDLAKKYNKPYYSHMEWLPEWRIFVSSEEEWGMEKRLIPYEVKMHYIRTYMYYTQYWLMANVRSLSAKCFNDTAQKFIGLQAPILTKYLGPDTYKLKEFLSSNTIKKKNEITCVARFVPHKRLHHVIQALKYIKFDGILNLVGYGEEKRFYDMINNEHIKINYLPSSEKLKAMSRSKVVVALWSGIVPAEAMYLGTPCITYDSPYMKELYKGTNIVFSPNNNVLELSKNIEKVLNKPYKEIKEECKQDVEMIESGKINTHTLKDSVIILNGIIKEAVK